jgi:hypothetical protein
MSGRPTTPRRARGPDARDAVGTDENDDPAAEWGDGAKTELNATVVAEARDPITAPHDLAALASSPEALSERALDKRFAATYAEGQEDALGSLRNVLLSKGLTNEETAHIVLAVRLGLTKL